MKRFSKICFLIAGIVAVIGVSLCITGVALGASISSVFSMIRDGRFAYYINHDGKLSYRGSDDEITDQSYEYDASDVENLDLSFNLGTVNVYKSDGSQIIVRYHHNSGDYTCRLKGSTLILEENHTIGINIGSEHQIDLYIPEDKVFKNVDIDMDAGKLSVQHIAAKGEVNLEVNAGKIEVERLIGGELELSCDAGAIEVTDASFTKHAELSTDLGTISFKTDGSEADYNYDLNADLGSISLNGSKKKDGIINNRADKQLEASCDAGKIDIYTD